MLELFHQARQQTEVSSFDSLLICSYHSWWVQRRYGRRCATWADFLKYQLNRLNKHFYWTPVSLSAGSSEVGCLVVIPVSSTDMYYHSSSSLTAGGYDAIWLLVFDPRQASPGVLLPLNRVEKLWRSWEKLNVSPLSAVESTSGQGVKLERLDDIVELKALIHT